MKSGSQSVKSHTLRDMMAAKNGQKHYNQNQKSWLRPVRDLRPKRGWVSSWGWRDIIEGLCNWSSTSPKEPILHLSLCPCTGYQLQLASSSRHWCLHIEQPQAQHPPTSTHCYEFTSPPEFWDLLVSDASWYHHREAQNHSPEHSLSPFLVGGMIFPPPSGMLDPCQISSNNWKLISFNSTWLHKKK